MLARKVVALVAAGAVGVAGCAGNLRHTTQPHRGVYENWAAVMRLPTGTVVKVEERSGAWAIGNLVARDSQGITLHARSGQIVVPRVQIRQLLMNHYHGDWKGIGDVVVGGVVGGLIGGLAVRKHRVIAVTALAAVGAFVGLVNAVMNLFVEPSDPPKQDEVLVYYTDRS